MKWQPLTRWRKQIKKFIWQFAVRHVFNTLSFAPQDGSTPLHLAVHSGHSAVVTKLLGSSADVGIKENLVNNISWGVSHNSPVLASILRIFLCAIGEEVSEKKDILDFFYESPLLEKSSHQIIIPPHLPSYWSLFIYTDSLLILS